MKFEDEDVGAIEVTLSMPDQQEVDEEGKRPSILMDATDIWHNGNLSAHHDGVNWIYRDADLYGLLEEEVASCERHGPAFQAEQADVIAAWLEIFAADLRKAFPPTAKGVSQ